MSDSNLVIPTAIPFERLRARELEECLYWLLDSMGAQELVWRIGTREGNTADQGRDIEAHFHVVSPDSDLVRQRWWIESKGRKLTVESSAVKEAVNNTQATPELDVLVIATNTTFSNPTRNWVKEWQHSHARPTIKLWDKNDLERLLCRYPSATLRVFARALTPQGRLEVIRERFWQHSSYATLEHLSELWAKRNDLSWEGGSLLAVVASELANGSINNHPWLMALECENVLGLLRFGLASALSFCMRAEEAGVDQGPYLEAMGYLILRALAISPGDEVRSVLENFLDVSEDHKQEMQGLLLLPIFNRLTHGVRNACTRDCKRVSLDLRGAQEEVAEHYWDRLRKAPKTPREEPAWKRYDLIIEAAKEPCKVGFHLGRKKGCPLLRGEDDKIDLKVQIDVLKRVIKDRVGPISIS